MCSAYDIDQRHEGILIYCGHICLLNCICCSLEQRRQVSNLTHHLFAAQLLEGEKTQNVALTNYQTTDQEIFRLKDEVEASEGLGVSFYDFLGIEKSANQEEINKAYRKKSRLLHPDKVKQQFIADKSTGKDKKKGSAGKKPGIHVSKGPSKAEIKATAKAASDRFARLGIVTNILRGEGRDRYDHFLSNGFPKWKGTGYYYARFRPGLGSVLAGLFIFVGGGGHWLALYMSWHRQREFMERYIKFARHAAWGDNFGIPGLDGTAAPNPATGADSGDAAQTLNRRQRRMQEKDSKSKAEKKPKGNKTKASPAATPPAGATGPRKRVVAENGKVLVVDSVGNVYLEQADEEGDTQEFLLDVSYTSYLVILISQANNTSPTNSHSLPSATQLSSASPPGHTTASQAVS